MLKSLEARSHIDRVHERKRRQKLFTFRKAENFTKTFHTDRISCYIISWFMLTLESAERKEVGNLIKVEMKIKNQKENRKYEAAKESDETICNCRSRRGFR